MRKEVDGLVKGRLFGALFDGPTTSKDEEEDDEKDERRDERAKEGRQVEQLAERKEKAVHPSLPLSFYARETPLSMRHRATRQGDRNPQSTFSRDRLAGRALVCEPISGSLIADVTTHVQRNCMTTFHTLRRLLHFSRLFYYCFCSSAQSDSFLFYRISATAVAASSPTAAINAANEGVPFSTDAS